MKGNNFKEGKNFSGWPEYIPLGKRFPDTVDKSLSAVRYKLIPLRLPNQFLSLVVAEIYYIISSSV